MFSKSKNKILATEDSKMNYTYKPNMETPMQKLKFKEFIHLSKKTITSYAFSNSKNKPKNDGFYNSFVYKSENKDKDDASSKKKQSSYFMQKTMMNTSALLKTDHGGSDSQM